ncbi:MAG TPA: glycosyltransferase family 39 protein [Steroidobacteraceae bacterium]|nr:glycosyltransferase family 39 protein [Steroidobacteraceae bacterium]
MWLSLALLVAWYVGMLGRGYWTPDEPREADIAWRMSWQPDKAVPLLAGEAFCEKPPLTYWAAAASIRLFGIAAWAARLPNLLYALVTALGVGLLARRSLDPIAGLAGAAAISTFLLSYQVAIWLATDAPLLATVTVALLGAYAGFYAERTPERLRGYALMHTALALGFLSKSAAAWMVPALAIVTLAFWERRLRELWRWELYAGLGLQAAIILPWVWFVYAGPDGPDHLRVFFWNNLVGRFTHIDAPQELQYAAAHRNSPGKYLLELPMYLWPWTLLVIAAARRAWRRRHAPLDEFRAVRFALASALPPLAVLSVAATARNIYLAPALPGFALLVAWWVRETLGGADRWDVHAVRATAALLVLAVLAFGAALGLVGIDAWDRMGSHTGFVLISGLGLMAAAALAVHAGREARAGRMLRGLGALLLGYCVLVTAPASQLYRQVDAWQNLASVGRAIEADSAGRPLVLFAPDETTRALIDLYARTSVGIVQGPIDPVSIERLQQKLTRETRAYVVVQLAGRSLSPALLRIADELGLKTDAVRDSAGAPAWISASQLRIAHRYALPNGRRYALLEAAR